MQLQLIYIFAHSQPLRVVCALLRTFQSPVLFPQQDCLLRKIQLYESGRSMPAILNNEKSSLFFCDAIFFSQFRRDPSVVRRLTTELNKFHIWFPIKTTTCTFLRWKKHRRSFQLVFQISLLKQPLPAPSFLTLPRESSTDGSRGEEFASLLSPSTRLPTDRWTPTELRPISLQLTYLLI